MSYSEAPWVTEQLALAVPFDTLRVALLESVELFAVTLMVPLDHVSHAWFDVGVTESVFLLPVP